MFGSTGLARGTPTLGTVAVAATTDKSDSDAYDEEDPDEDDDADGCRLVGGGAAAAAGSSGAFCNEAVGGVWMRQCRNSPASMEADFARELFDGLGAFFCVGAGPGDSPAASKRAILSGRSLFASRLWLMCTPWASTPVALLLLLMLPAIVLDVPVLVSWSLVSHCGGLRRPYLLIISGSCGRRLPPALVRWGDAAPDVSGTGAICFGFSPCSRYSVILRRVPARTFFFFFFFVLFQKERDLEIDTKQKGKCMKQKAPTQIPRRGQKRHTAGRNE